MALHWLIIYWNAGSKFLERTRGCHPSRMCFVWWCSKQNRHSKVGTFCGHEYSVTQCCGKNDSGGWLQVSIHRQDKVWRPYLVCDRRQKWPRPWCNVDCEQSQKCESGFAFQRRFLCCPFSKVPKYNKIEFYNKQENVLVRTTLSNEWQHNRASRPSRRCALCDGRTTVYCTTCDVNLCSSTHHTQRKSCREKFHTVVKLVRIEQPAAQGCRGRLGKRSPAPFRPQHQSPERETTNDPAPQRRRLRSSCWPFKTVISTIFQI